jgi:hypothetical protein
MKFIYVTAKAGYGGQYVRADRIVTIMPDYSKPTPKYCCRYEAGGDELAVGYTEESVGDLINARPRTPAPAGFTLNGRPVLFLEHCDAESGGALLAAVFTEDQEIQFTSIHVRGHIADLVDYEEREKEAEAKAAAERAVSEADAAGVVEAEKALEEAKAQAAKARDADFDKMWA